MTAQPGFSWRMTQGSERLLFMVAANQSRGPNSRRQALEGECCDVAEHLPARTRAVPHAVLGPVFAASYERIDENVGHEVMKLGDATERLVRRIRKTMEAQDSAIQSDKKGSRRHTDGGPPSPTAKALKGGLGTPERNTKCV